MNCDLVFINGKYLDVETREFVLGNILIKDGKICGINKEYICDNISRQALHCAKISFFHPITNKYLEITADIPNDISILLQQK